MTCQEVLDALTRRKKNLADLPTATFLDWCDEMNRFAYRVIYANEPERYFSSETYNVIAGTSAYNLPDDFYNMQPLGSGFFIVQNGQPLPQTIPKTNVGSNYDGYYLQRDQVIFTPVPQQNATVLFRYIPQIDRITSLSDTLVIPDEFFWYTVDATDVAYDVWDEDPGAEALADQRFARKLSELAKFIRRDPSTVGLNTNSNAF